MTRLSIAHCEQAMAKGEFGPEITASTSLVAVILTQSWCPQWIMMRRWLDRAESDTASRVFFLEYDQEDFFDAFMAFKEDVFGNRSVPYIRYYRDGVFTGDGNFIGRDGFVAKLTRL
jgi:hypothetical protein